MNTASLSRQFALLNTRVRFAALLDTLWPGADRVLVLAGRDDAGAFVEVRADPSRPVQLHVLDVSAATRQLLLRATWPNAVGALTQRRHLVRHEAARLTVDTLPHFALVVTVASADAVLRAVPLDPDGTALGATERVSAAMCDATSLN